MWMSLISVMAVMMGPAAVPAGAAANAGPACRMMQDEPHVVTDLDVPEPVFADQCDRVPEGRSGSIPGAVIDPRAFFDQLVLRYRAMAVYRDVTRIIQKTRYNDDREPTMVETEIQSDITDDVVSIRTPISQLLRAPGGLGLVVPLASSDELDAARRSYELWLLPHLTLKLSDEPLKEFREGVAQGFTATEAVSITVDDRPMVHLELKSGDGLSEDYEARFDLYVDPDSMLIERIQGEQRLPDGGHYETTLEIAPSYVEARKTEPGHEPGALSAWPATAKDDEAVEESNWPEPTSPAPVKPDEPAADPVPEPEPKPAPRPGPEPASDEEKDADSPAPGDDGVPPAPVGSSRAH